MYTRMFIEVLQKKVYCCISGALFSETYIIYFKTALHWIGGYLNYLWRGKRRTVVTAFLVHI